MGKDDVEAEFQTRVVWKGGICLLAAGDALDMIERAHEESVPILGIDGFEVVGGSIRPSLNYLADFSSGVQRGDGCWLDAKNFVEEHRSAGLLFEIVLGSAFAG
jgi:hypothetical protein